MGYMNMTERDSHGHFIKGSHPDNPRDEHGRFKPKEAIQQSVSMEAPPVKFVESAMVPVVPDVKTVEEVVDALPIVPVVETVEPAVVVAPVVPVDVDKFKHVFTSKDDYALRIRLKLSEKQRPPF